MGRRGPFRSARSSYGLTPINRYTVPRELICRGRRAPRLNPAPRPSAREMCCHGDTVSGNCVECFLVDWGSLAAVGIALCVSAWQVGVPARSLTVAAGQSVHCLTDVPRNSASCFRGRPNCSRGSRQGSWNPSARPRRGFVALERVRCVFGFAVEHGNPPGNKSHRTYWPINQAPC